MALSLAVTSLYLKRVVNAFNEDILRIMGVAGFREKGAARALLHAVQNKFYPVLSLDHWPDTDTRTLDTGRIDELFSALCV